MSQYKIDLNDEFKSLLIYAIQLDEADELLKYAQDMSIEKCRCLWKSYIKYDRTTFNKFMVGSTKYSNLPHKL